MTEPDTPSEDSGSISSSSWTKQKLISTHDLNKIRKQRPRNRMTTTETITYEREDGEPFQVPIKAWRPIKQDTQPYQREIKITEEWKPIDLGWAVEWDGIGTISIEHLGDKTPQKNPTSEERLENASRSFYAALGSDLSSYIEVYPKDGFRAILSDPRALRIRSKNGVIRAMLTIFPS